jgi:hypothetical protein
MQQNWLGLRPEDLSDAERTLLARDRKLSAVHRAELNFGMHLENLPYLGRVLVLDDVKNYAVRMGPFSEAKKDRSWLLGLPLVLVVVAMGGVMAFSNKAGRDPLSQSSFIQATPAVSKLVGEPGAVSMTAWAGHATGSRPVIEGSAIQRTEGLMLELHVRGSGHAVIGNVQSGERLFPLDEALFFIEDGTYRVGRKRAAVFRFTDSADQIHLRSYFCAAPVVGFPLSLPAGCQVAEFGLHFFDE